MKVFYKMQCELRENISVFFLSIVFLFAHMFLIFWFQPDVVTNVGFELEKSGESDSAVIHHLAGQPGHIQALRDFSRVALN